jgi:hypothetical protein
MIKEPARGIPWAGSLVLPIRGKKQYAESKPGTFG